MRYVVGVWRQVALLAPRAHKMSSHLGSPKITPCQRGAFILFEGGDRCGKTTQSQSLVDHLQASGVRLPNVQELSATSRWIWLGWLQVKAELWKFPDRQTGTGRMIDSYLTSKTELDDAAVHLLFCANRWEKRSACTRIVLQTQASHPCRCQNCCFSLCMLPQVS